jgi:hypothetical protein
MNNLYDDSDIYGGPSEDDDDDDDIDLLEDIESEVEADKKATPSNNNSTQPNINPHQSPFGGNNNSGTSNTWATAGGSSWNGRAPYTSGNQGQTVFPGWNTNPSTNNGFGNNNGNTNNGGLWNGNNRSSTTPTWGNSWNSGYNNNGNRQSLPRNKRIICCDLLDNVIESLTANGRVGVQPHGIYDMRIKFEVLDRFRAINPEYVFVLTNQNFTPGTPAGNVYKAMIDYLMYSIAEYMRMPYENVRCITKTGYDVRDKDVKPNTGLLQKALSSIPDVKNRFKKEDILVCGSASGLAGQGNRDIEMARRFGVDYIDIQELLNYYF